MEQFLASHEGAITWWLFVTAFVCVGLAETFQPLRSLVKPTARRWAGNGVLAATHILVDAIYPLGATVLAVLVLKSPYGLLNGPRLPLVLRFALALILLDLLRYVVHYLFHRLSFLWRIHQVHHSDPDFDLTTGVRNHPLEVLIVQGSYFGAVALIAPPPLAVIAVGFATVIQNLVSHANLRLPVWFEAPLRRILITPDMHRIHHSAEIREQNTNFGFLFPWWDRLFRTYCATPVLGHDRMGIGLAEFRDDRTMNALHLLAMPFRSQKETVAPGGAPGQVAHNVATRP